MDQSEPHACTAASASTGDCTFAALEQTMREFKAKFPDPPLKRLRVTQWLYDAFKARLMPPSDDLGPIPDWPFDSMSLRGVPIVVDLPGDHLPGWEAEYARMPPAGCEFLDMAMGIGLQPWPGMLDVFRLPPSILSVDPERVTATEIGILAAHQDLCMKSVQKQARRWEHQVTIEALYAPIKEIEPARRRGYLRSMYRDPAYRNGSRRTKTLYRRALLSERVARF